MSLFTLTLNELLEYESDIGLSDYPIHDPAHRPILNEKILNHYDAREIGYESGSQFKFALKRRMHEIMPYYNQLYKSELLVIDPLNTNKMHSEDSTTSESNEASTGTSTSDTTNTGKGRNVSYVTPQTALAGSEDYADAASDSESTGATAGTSDNTGSSNSDSTTVSTSDTLGFSGSQSDLLNLYRTTFLNIDMLIIDNLADLFMQVWDSGNVHNEQTGYGFGYGYGLY